MMFALGVLIPLLGSVFFLIGLRALDARILLLRPPVARDDSERARERIWTCRRWMIVVALVLLGCVAIGIYFIESDLRELAAWQPGRR